MTMKQLVEDARSRVTAVSPADATAVAQLTGMRRTGRVHVLCTSGGRGHLCADTLDAMGYESDLIEGGLCPPEWPRAFPSRAEAWQG
ncbi:hypothetical protein [Halodurantibacterium flavum]|uniref:Rhodanese-like domain-containing protein n=1 Tax=Halodurantibacterium flavum TaxID=1382802 RepID=A0ABW4S081_9RHOB